MHVGNSEQSSTTNRQNINSSDNVIWFNAGVRSRAYHSTDYNMDGLITASDKLLWNLNAGKVTSVRKD